VKATISTRKALAIVLSAIVLTAIVTYVFAASSNIPFTINGGNYPGAPSYTVWCEGSNYFAKNASGVVEFSGTNVSEIWVNVIAYGGTLFFKSGEYDFQNATLQSTKAFTLYGECSYHGASTPSTVFKNVVLNISKSYSAVYNLLIQEGSINVEGDIGDVYFENVHVVNSPSDAFTIKDAYGVTLLNCKVYSSNGRGYNALHANGLNLIGCVADNASIGFRFTRSSNSPSGTAAKGTSMINCLSRRSRQHGIFAEGIQVLYIGSGTRVEESSLETASSYDDLVLSQDSNGNPCRTVTIESVHLASSQARHGINVEYVDGLTIDDVFLSGQDTTGIRLTGNAYNVKVGYVETDYVDGTPIYNAATNAIFYGSGFVNSASFSNVANGTAISHGLISTPDVVIVTLSTNGYSWYSANSTHIILYFSVTTASGSWYAEYKP